MTAAAPTPSDRPDAFAALPSARHWARVGTDKRAGVCVPLFSLRTRRGGAIGDLGDLPALIDACAATGLSVLQLLPLNDMGLDTCPYSAISAFATDPAFVALDRLPGVPTDATFDARVRAEAARLGAAPRVDYAEARRVKLGLLQDAFGRVERATLERELDAFRAANPWLPGYALYRVMKETQGWRSWESWGAGLADEAAREAARRDHAEHVAFVMWVQWVLARQLEDVRRYAEARGVWLMGDVPILIGRDSADVWLHPRFFHLDRVAGAPPDMYAEDGQNWGFPTYDWDALAADGHTWWRQRLALAERAYHLYRIDHIVGFFRIWTIPYGERGGRKGWFEPHDEATWGAHGRGILEMMLDASDMLPLGEDLGTIPHVCRQTMSELGICGMKVDRWERRWEGDRGYIDPADFPALSLATLSTHDSDTLAGWWEAPATRHDVQVLYETIGGQGPAPATLPADLHVQLVRRISRARSRFVVYMLQDLLQPLGYLKGGPAENRVNVPGTVGPHNWTWRMPLAVEDLVADEGARAALADMVRRA